MGVQHELRKEENKIKMELMELQTFLIPQIESLQKQAHKSEDLVNTHDVSAMDNMISLAVDIGEKFVLSQTIKDSWKVSLKDAQERYKNYF